MYITSDLFEPHGYSNSSTSSSSNSWNITMADAQTTIGLGKRKRHLDADEGPSARSHSLFHYASTASNRGPNKSQAHSQGPVEVSNRICRYSFSTQPHARSDFRVFKQLKRSPPKATLVKIPSHLMELDLDLPPTTPSAPASTATNSESDLRACNVCHNAPKRKKDLENYLQCQNCDKRACYVCARDCIGGCQKRLCSRCCVEEGEEGDTWCLDCFQQKCNS